MIAQGWGTSCTRLQASSTQAALLCPLGGRGGLEQWGAGRGLCAGVCAFACVPWHVTPHAAEFGRRLPPAGSWPPLDYCAHPPTCPSDYSPVPLRPESPAQHRISCEGWGGGVPGCLAAFVYVTRCYDRILRHLPFDDRPLCPLVKLLLNFVFQLTFQWYFHVNLWHVKKFQIKWN